MIDLDQHSQDIYDSLVQVGDHTFRYGKVLMSIGSYEWNERTFAIHSVSASYDGDKIDLPDSLYYVNVVIDQDPLTTAYKVLSDTVRRAAVGY
jgi:hypothetical protein